MNGAADTSLEALYRRHGPMVLRRARMLLRDEEAARDALQEVFMTVLRSEAPREGAWVSWLYRTTTHHCLNRIRDAGRRDELFDAKVAPALTEEASGDPEERVLVQQLMGRLPDELREVATYYYLDRMSHEEIATLTGLARRTVGYRLERFVREARALAGEELGS